MSSSGNHLRFLDSLTPLDAQAALSAATSSLLPDPGVAKEVKLAADADVVARVLRESRLALGIEEGSFSAESRSQLLEFLSDRLIDRVLTNADETQIKNRLGDSGDLRDDLFGVSLTKDNADQLAKFGIFAANLKDAVRHPDRVQHLRPDQIRMSGLDQISLLLQLPTAISRADPFSLLVLTTRKGSEHVIDAAFRIYHSDVAVGESTSPLAALRNFLDRYGLFVEVGNHLRTKLSMYEVIPFDPKVGVMPVRLVDEPTPIPAFSMVARIRMQEHLHVIEVGLAYAVDLRKYVRDLVKHGVKASL